MAISTDKVYLLILIPIVIAAVIFLMKKYIKRDRYVNTGTVLRTLTVIALILSLSGFSVIDKANDDTTLFLTDISDSAAKSSSKAAEFIEAAQANKKSGDKTAVALFAGRAVTTVPPTTDYVTVNLDVASVNKEDTNIEAGIKHALSSFDEDTKKRLVLITDGSETKGDAKNTGMSSFSIGITLLSMPKYQAF